MFPSELDGAKVLYYTPEWDYGAQKFPNGDIVDRFRYLAICKYIDDEQYYLFFCDESYEVINDRLANTVEACMRLAASHEEDIFWIKK